MATPPLSPVPPPPPPLPASLPPLPEEEEGAREGEPRRPDNQQETTTTLPRAATPTPPVQPQQTRVPLAPLPTLRRSGPSEWETAELRDRYRALERKYATLEAVVQEKDGKIEAWTQRAKAEAARRERAEARAVALAARRQGVEQEYGELVAVLDRLQHRVRQLRANERRAEGEMERLRGQNREAATALLGARRLLAASDARIHKLEVRRLEGELEALRLQSKVVELEQALGAAEAEMQGKPTPAEAPLPHERRPLPTAPTTEKPGSLDAELEGIWQANLRLQEQLRRTAPSPAAVERPTTTAAAAEAPLLSTSTTSQPLSPRPASPSHILGAFPRTDPTQPTQPTQPLPPRSSAPQPNTPPHIRLYGFNPARVQQAMAAARAEVSAHHKGLSWREASAVLRVLHQHHRCPHAQASPSLNVLTCLRRNSTFDQPAPVLRAFLRAMGEGPVGP